MSKATTSTKKSETPKAATPKAPARAGSNVAKALAMMSYDTPATMAEIVKVTGGRTMYNPMNKLVAKKVLVKHEDGGYMLAKAPKEPKAKGKKAKSSK